MMRWSVGSRNFHIRDAETEADFRETEEIQREVWGFSDLDIVPAATLIATQWAGGMLLCAFEGERMIGFAYGFPAHEQGRVSIHSHMLAVRAEYRNLQIGFLLKAAQRKRATEMGVNEITWTFDPLQSLNAHLNFAKLGVIARRYIVNFYGETSSSPLHQGFGTDRLWVNWLLESERVVERIKHIEEGLKAEPARPVWPIDDSSLLVRRKGDSPQFADMAGPLSQNYCLIEIPHDVTSLKQRDPETAVRWREATRKAFLAATEAGFIVEDFLKHEWEGGSRWLYLLTRKG
ncbi:MAG TPA: GNAT family N-acetyltransferase [Blastocatellia bacterium]|nr:GNAT family N-acetyltransferase [Blastocatellia bacterium]